MPTARPRHSITETDEITAALAVAATEWPDDRERPSRLLLHLFRQGQEAVTGRHRQRIVQRQQAVDQVAGAFTGMYPPGCLRRLREDWPD